MTRSFCIVTATNDPECLQRNLLASRMVVSGTVPVHAERGAPSASIAYNRGLAATTADIVIFAHQDVYFPQDFLAALRDEIDRVEAMDPNWALIAPFGMSRDGRHLGHVWSTSLGRCVGASTSEPVPVVSFDELAIVLRRDSGITFDDALPLYHLYGTDVVQTALHAGRGAYVVDLPVVHNDGFHDGLGDDFAQGYHYVRRKWRKALPLRTPVLWIRWHGLDLAWYRLRAWYSRRKRAAVAVDNTGDPRVFARRCGWEPSAR